METCKAVNLPSYRAFLPNIDSIVERYQSKLLHIDEREIEKALFSSRRTISWMFWGSLALFVTLATFNAIDPHTDITPIIVAFPGFAAFFFMILLLAMDHVQRKYGWSSDFINEAAYSQSFPCPELLEPIGWLALYHLLYRTLLDSPNLKRMKLRHLLRNLVHLHERGLVSSMLLRTAATLLCTISAKLGPTPFDLDILERVNSSLVRSREYVENLTQCTCYHPKTIKPQLDPELGLQDLRKALEQYLLEHR